MPPPRRRRGPAAPRSAIGPSAAIVAAASITSGLAPDNHLQYPTDLVLLVVSWRLRYTLRPRDLAAIFLERGFVFGHEAVRDRVARPTPPSTADLRAERRGRGGMKWHADETHVRVDGGWCYPYRAIDREGNLVDALLGERRDMAAAQRFFARALGRAGRPPSR